MGYRATSLKSPLKTSLYLPFVTSAFFCFCFLVSFPSMANFFLCRSTPWKRVVNYDVPKAMPPCPQGGCICAWGWVPNHCGQPNMYMQPFKCMVTGATSTTPIAPPKPPVWCEGNPSACTKGSKQMVYCALIPLLWGPYFGTNFSFVKQSTSLEVTTSM